MSPSFFHSNRGYGVLTDAVSFCQLLLNKFSRCILFSDFFDLAFSKFCFVVIFALRLIINCAASFVHIMNILFLSTGIKMPRITTRGIIAFMKNEQISWVSIFQYISKTRSVILFFIFSTASRKSPVTAYLSSRRPLPAFVSFSNIYFIPKSFHWSVLIQSINKFKEKLHECL